MYICMCNPFTDKDVQRQLLERGERKCKVSEIYHACTDGEQPNCRCCLEGLKEIVSEHNQKAIIEASS